MKAQSLYISFPMYYLIKEERKETPPWYCIIRLGIVLFSTDSLYLFHICSYSFC